MKSEVQFSYKTHNTSRKIDNLSYVLTYITISNMMFASYCSVLLRSDKETTKTVNHDNR